MRLEWPWRQRRSDVLWLDLGDFGILVTRDNPEKWQDHGLGLLRTILHQHGIPTDILSIRAMTSWSQLRRRMRGYRTLIMNVRSYTFSKARRAAQVFKELNPNGLVLTGGVHASVALDEMEAVHEFDKICQGPGENVIVDLVRDPGAFPRVFSGKGARSMAEWPRIDRTLWPKPVGWRVRRTYNWPLEPTYGWGPAPVATILSSRVCPWQCAFCSENAYISPAGRRPVDAIIDELNDLDNRYGLGSVVFHDSMFFQNPAWLREWQEKYPSKANKTWPYFAAARADTVRRWPELFEALVRETNWTTVSIGLESGSDRMLRLLNKECTAEDNNFTIDLVNRIGDDLERQGKEPPKFWSNIIMGIPGETREDAFMTMRMHNRIKRGMRSVAFFAPYPGAALGYQLIAEGKSLMTKGDYSRYPNEAKVKGVDYPFYRDLLAGKYDEEVSRAVESGRRDRGSADAAQEPVLQTENVVPKRHRMYLFSMKNGKKKLAYGENPEDALEILGFRLTDEEMAGIVKDDWRKVSQRDLQKYVHLLG